MVDDDFDEIRVLDIKTPDADELRESRPAFRVELSRDLDPWEQQVISNRAQYGDLTGTEDGDWLSFDAEESEDGDALARRIFDYLKELQDEARQLRKSTETEADQLRGVAQAAKQKLGVRD